ncbi:toll-like receptor 21 [Trichomycterus rosablanca]|uniref:toll-like receptor 21 n=1 Tax=Trichomycterus rosablanca TaxID=2290929 RepID=UPI002F35FE33
MATWMHDALFFMALVASVFKLSMSYGFRNCIESAASNRTIFKCTNRQAWSVKAIVNDVPFSATNITISFCKLSQKHVMNNSFIHLPNMQVLQLDNNNLKSVGKDAFVNLWHLQTLNLSTNDIANLDDQVFHSLYNLTGLILSVNKLTNLPSDLFCNLKNLESLDLRRNQLINFSEVVQSIWNLKMLKKLDLSFNRLTSLTHSTSLPQSLASIYLGNNILRTMGCKRDFLSNVKELDLSNNRFLSYLHHLNLSSLKYLRLRSTNISIIEFLNNSDTKVPAWNIDFSGLKLNKSELLLSLCKQLSHYPRKNISRMFLQSNGIRILNYKTLSLCPSIIRILDLSYNELKSTNCLQFLKTQTHLSTLRIEHNHLTKLGNCSRNSNTRFYNLRELSYRYNRILQVNAFAFSNTPKLTTLSLNINIIAYLDHKALCGLKDLVTLRLDNNLLTDLYADSFKDLHSLQTLNLRNNQIAVIFNNTFHSLRNLIILDLGGNKITQLRPKAFDGLTSLNNLYLDRNRLTEIDGQLLGRLHATLQVLDLNNNHIKYITEHEYSPFVNLTKLIHLKLDSQLPYGIRFLPHKFFRGLKSLKSLYIQNNHIYHFSSDTFDDLKNLTFLTLDDSCDGVIQLKPLIFKNLRKLEILLLENMGIQSVSKEVFGNLTNLRVLHLNRNALQTLDINLLENLTNLEYLDLRDSPLSCHCPNTELQNWTKNSQRVQIVYLYNLTCPDLQGSNFYNFDTNVCYSFDLEIYMFASTCVATILLTLIPLLYVKLYWKFKYGYYVFRSWVGEQWRRLQEEEEKCKYDAFISYNSADEKWVMEQLLPNLEGNGSAYRLCLHHRDFEPGCNIVDNIVSAVYNSRKTICVVSQNFLRSEWCSLEIQLASYRLFDEMQDVLLLVFLDSIPERQLSTYHRMRKVMLKKTYMQWPGPNCTDPDKAEEIFWRRLKRALRSSNHRNQEEEEQMEVHVQSKQQKNAATLEEDEAKSQMDEPYYLMP